jgi:threonyl-tRNA synthetase
VPYLLVVGDRELAEHSVTVRARGTKETVSFALEDAVGELVASAAPPQT